MQHHEYVFQNSFLYVYDIDNGFNLVKSILLPTGGNPRGAIASSATGMLYVSYGPDSSAGGGSMFKYDLVNNLVVWNKTYPFGIDSMSINPDGSTIYMPTGEVASGGIWQIIDASSGNVTGSIDSGGAGPHNTLLNAQGTHVYMGPRGSNYLVEADASSHRIIQQIGPITPASGTMGIRPFTINGAETLAFITVTGLLGFQVGDITTGKILYQVPIQGFSWDGTGGLTAPSHGISISPDEKELYVMDAPNSYVHVYDISGLPGRAPIQVADLPLTGNVPGVEQGCPYDCFKEGWLHHSRDGAYVFVGDAGDVIDTRTRRTVAVLPAMANTRVFIEVDFQNGVPVWAMANRSSAGTITPPQSGISLVQSKATEGSAVTSVSAAFPTVTTAGNLIIAFVRMSTSTQTVSVTDTAGDLYADAVSQTQTVDGHQIHIFYATNIAGSPNNTVTAAFSGTNNHPWLAIFEYSGLSTTNPLDKTAAAEGSGVTPGAGPTAVTTSANELVFAAAGDPAGYPGTLSPGTGYTLGQQDTGTSPAETESAIVSATGAFSASFSASTSTNWTAVIATFAASSGVSGPSITTTSLPDGQQNTAYSATVTAMGGATPYTWSLASGTLPAGLTLAAATGVISGTPTGTGTSNFTIQVIDANSQTATAALSIAIASAAPPTIALVQSNAVEGSALTSISTSFPGANTAGNLIIAFVRMSTTTQTVTLTDSAGNTYTEAVTQAQHSDNHQVHLFYARNIVGGANTVTAAFSATNNHPWLATFEYSGLSTTNPLDKTAAAEGSGVTPSAGPTAVTTSANELVFAATGDPAGYPGTLSPGTGYTVGQQDTGTSRGETEAGIVSATGAFSASFSASTSTNWSAVIATFKP